jgi:hypothetical protein
MARIERSRAWGDFAGGTVIFFVIPSWQLPEQEISD